MLKQSVPSLICLAVAWRHVSSQRSEESFPAGRTFGYRHSSVRHCESLLFWIVALFILITPCLVLPCTPPEWFCSTPFGESSLVVWERLFSPWPLCLAMTAELVVDTFYREDLNSKSVFPQQQVSVAGIRNSEEERKNPECILEICMNVTEVLSPQYDLENRLVSFVAGQISVVLFSLSIVHNRYCTVDMNKTLHRCFWSMLTDSSLQARYDFCNEACGWMPSRALKYWLIKRFVTYTCSSASHDNN